MGAAPRKVTISTSEVVDSTNDTIHAAGEANHPEGTTHIARQQRRGRGRAGRTWWSPTDVGLWMSTLLRPGGKMARWSGISLIAGAAVRAAVRELGVEAAEVHWPNDIFVGGRKLGGILAESQSRRGRTWIALGIGLNIDLSKSDVPEELRSRITSLAQELAPSATPSTFESLPAGLEPLALAGEILQQFWPRYDRFLEGAELSEVVEAESLSVGRRISVRLEDGATLYGTIAGVGAHGELRIRVDSRDQGAPPLVAEAASVLPTEDAEVLAIISGDVSYDGT